MEVLKSDFTTWMDVQKIWEETADYYVTMLSGKSRLVRLITKDRDTTDNLIKQQIEKRVSQNLIRPQEKFLTKIQLKLLARNCVPIG